MKTALVAVGALLAIAAVSPGEVVPDLQARGFYIEQGADADEDAVSAAVAEARFDGGRLSVVVLAAEPAGGATTFSDAALDGLGAGTVFTVGPETVGYASQGDVWTQDELDRAVEASLEGSTSTDVVLLFTATLTGSPVEGREPAGGGSGIWVFLLVALAVAALIGFFVWRSARKGTEKREAKLREVVQGKLDDVANDIIDLEDEVQTSGNEEARQHYERASESYAATQSAFERMENVDDMLVLSTKLDEAIWELDCAEAVLDGKPLPPKPEPPRAAPAPVAQPTQPVTGTDYVRRTGRRSSYSGPQVSDLIIGMMAGSMMSRGRGSRSYRSSGSRSTGSRSSGRIRGGGRRRG